MMLKQKLRNSNLETMYRHNMTERRRVSQEPSLLNQIFGDNILGNKQPYHFLKEQRMSAVPFINA